MGTVGRRVARFIVRQVRRIERIVSHPHRFGAIAKEGAQGVQGIGCAVGISDRRMGENHLAGAFPDQDAHLAGAFVRFKDLAQAADVRNAAQASQRRVGQVEGDEKSHAGHGQTDPAQPGPAEEARPAPPFIVAAAQGNQPQEYEDVKASKPPQPGSATLRENDSNALHHQHEHIGAHQEGVSNLPALFGQQAPGRAQKTLQRDEKGNNQVG